ncbi:MAG TPA: hypothetical protein VG297_03665 [Bryobacteraceae bacterium]|nr:hypothetical protein [Bryobacteraceae bacterium]
MMPLTAALVISNRTVWEQTHGCVQNLPVRLAVEQGVALSDAAETDALLDRIERHRVDVVLVETGAIALPFEEFVRRLRDTASQPAVFVLNPEASPALILEALRAGASEYLYPPLGDALRDAFERLSANRSKAGADSGSSLGKVFGFLSARGGCGATTIAVHVATAIARQAASKQNGAKQGRTQGSMAAARQPMLLADFDFEAGLLRFLMKTKNNYSVRDAIDNLRRMDASLWKGLVSAYTENMDIIPSPDEVAAKRPPDREEMTHLVRFIRSTYPIAIVDFGRSVSVAALDALPELEVLYLVTTPDAGSVESARRAVRIIEERGVAGNRFKVLLNRGGDNGKFDASGIEKTLGRSCDAIFRNDHMALYDAYSEGRFLSPASALGKEFGALAYSIRARSTGEHKRAKGDAERRRAAGDPEPGAAEKTNEQPKGPKRWFSFLSGSAKPQEQTAQAEKAVAGVRQSAQA